MQAPFCRDSFMPFFSVVIPVYNRADLVSATLDSVLAQSCTDWELIVVDDGSTDGTLEVLESYREKLGARMQVLRQNHAGPGAARNRALSVATGRYIAFLDSDDLWFAWTLEFYARILEQHDLPAFLMGEPQVFESQKSWETARNPALEEAMKNAQIEAFADYLSAQLPTDWFSVSSFVVRRDALNGKAFCAHPINGEDIDFSLQLGIEPGFVNVKQAATFGYRKHAGGVTRNYRRTVAGMEFLIASERAGRYPGGKLRRRERLTLLSRHLRPALLQFLVQGHRRRAWRSFARTLGWHLELGRFRFLVGFVARSLQLKRRSGRNGPPK